MPIGTIIAYGANDWYKPSEASKWLLCDGSLIDATRYPKLATLMSNTPDLRDKFLTGAGISYVLGDTGGKDKFLLSTNEIPSLSIDGTGYYVTGGASFVYNVYFGSRGWYNYGMDSGTGVNIFMSPFSNLKTVGGSAEHENRPPFYAVKYYIRAK